MTRKAKESGIAAVKHVIDSLEQLRDKLDEIENKLPFYDEGDPAYMLDVVEDVILNSSDRNLAKPIGSLIDVQTCCGDRELSWMQCWIDEVRATHEGDGDMELRFAESMCGVISECREKLVAVLQERDQARARGEES